MSKSAKQEALESLTALRDLTARMVDEIQAIPDDDPDLDERVLVKIMKHTKAAIELKASL